MVMTMLGTTIYVCLIFINFAVDPAESTQKCFSCASPGLQNQWHITGLPNKPGSNQWLSSCAEPSTISDPTQKAALLINCEGVCMSYMLQVVAADGETADTTKLWVRGCHERLADLNTNQRVTTAYCEFGKLQVKNAKNTFTALERGIDFCTADSCNVVKDEWATKSCVGKQGQSNVPTSCVKCGPYSKDCKKDMKQNPGCMNTRWCTKSAVKIGELDMYTHSCSPVNPFGGSMCRGFWSSSYIEPFPLQARGDTCYCEYNYCNGAVAAVSSILGVFLSLFVAHFVLRS